MNINDIIRKLTARKLWLALLLIGMGCFIGSGGDPSELEQILGTAMKTLGALGFIAGEAAVDVARLKYGNAQDKEGGQNG